MQRKPQAKSQADILVREMKAAGTPIKRQQALDMVARMSGFRDWNAMAAAPQEANTSAAPVPVPVPVKESAESKTLRKLIARCWDLLNTCDSTGCDGLTVASEEETDALREFLEDLNAPSAGSSDMDRFDPKTQIAITWSVYDVLSKRPDLTLSEALDVLHQCKRKHDAEVGITWDSIAETANWFFDERKLTGTIEFVGNDGTEITMPAVVSLENQGRVYVDGKPLREFNPAADGDFTVDGYPSEDFPVLKGRLFGNENNDGDIQCDDIQEMLDKLEKANALPNISKY